MTVFQPGLVHTPVTPFTRDHRIDFDCFGKLIDFHIRNGADALALPMHAGESVSLTDDEQHAAARVRGQARRRPRAGDRARERRRHRHRGRAARATRRTPAPPPSSPPRPITGRRRPRWCSSISRRSARRCGIPFFVYNSPEDMPGTQDHRRAVPQADRAARRISPAWWISSLDWQFMIELMTYAPAAAGGFPAARGHRTDGLGRRDRRDRDVLAARRHRAEA